MHDILDNVLQFHACFTNFHRTRFEMRTTNRFIPATAPTQEEVGHVLSALNSITNLGLDEINTNGMALASQECRSQNTWHQRNNTVITQEHLVSTSQIAALLKTSIILSQFVQSNNLQ